MDKCLVCGNNTKSTFRICSKHSQSKINRTATVRKLPVQSMEKQLLFHITEFSKLIKRIPEPDEADKNELESYERIKKIVEQIPGASISRDSSMENLYEFDSTFSSDVEN